MTDFVITLSLFNFVTDNINSDIGKYTSNGIGTYIADEGYIY